MIYFYRNPSQTGQLPRFYKLFSNTPGIRRNRKQSRYRHPKDFLPKGILRGCRAKVALTTSSSIQKTWLKEKVNSQNIFTLQISQAARMATWSHRQLSLIIVLRPLNPIPAAGLFHHETLASLTMLVQDAEGDTTCLTNTAIPAKLLKVVWL